MALTVTGGVDADPIGCLFRTFGENWGMEIGNGQTRGVLRQRACFRHRV